MCSSTRGPAMAPSLVTWPTSTSANFPALASWISSKLEARTCATVPGALSIASSHMVWIEFDHHQRGVAGRLQAGGDVAQVDRGGEFQRRVMDAEATGAHPHLLDRFLAGHVEHAPAGPRQAGGRLQQQGGLADPGIAADQHRRGRHQPAAQHPVQFGDAGRAARRRFGAAGQADEFDTRLPAAALPAGPGRAAMASSTMLFHSPQVSQRPAHFGLTAPQLWQTKREVGLAKLLPWGTEGVGPWWGFAPVGCRPWY